MTFSAPHTIRPVQESRQSSTVSRPIGSHLAPVWRESSTRSFSRSSRPRSNIQGVNPYGDERRPKVRSPVRPAKPVPALPACRLNRLPVGNSPLGHCFERRVEGPAELGQLVQRGRLHPAGIEVAPDKPVALGPAKCVGQHLVRDTVQAIVEVLVSTAAVAELDGYVTAGDFGWLDDEGYLYLADRRSDLIISGGVNTYPAEIEATLMENEAVVDAAVIGVPRF